MTSGKDSVFISCGQRPEDLVIREALPALVRELTPFEPYVAKYQQTVDGLHGDIFRALETSAGMIVVLHERGAVEHAGKRHARASVWVEQEIAIAAFIQHALRPLPVLAYVQKGIELEGLRTLLALNPMEFTKNDEIIRDLRWKLPTWQGASAGWPLDVAFIASRQSNLDADRATFRLQVRVTNRGRFAIEKFWVEIDVPRWILGSATFTGMDGQRSTEFRGVFSIAWSTWKSRLPIAPGASLDIWGIDVVAPRDADKVPIGDAAMLRAVLTQDGAPRRGVTSELSAVLPMENRGT